MVTISLRAIPSGLPDSIPARVYNQRAAEETLHMADQVLALVGQKLLRKV